MKHQEQVLRGCENMTRQVRIPTDLSPQRYISGVSALNLPAPENTTGDWHFLNCFYRRKPHDDEKKFLDVVYIAGEGENSRVNTNAIWGTWGLYECSETLKCRKLIFNGTENWAANHFRAILDMLYREISEGKDACWIQGASEDWLDSAEQKALLLKTAEAMKLHLSDEQIKILDAWIAKERKICWGEW